MSVSDRSAAPNRPGADAATAVWRHRDATPLALTLLAAAALTGLVSRELAGSTATASAAPSGPHAPAETIAVQGAVRDVPPDQLLARPLFAASRRPALVDPAAPVAIVADDPPHLVGTLMTGQHDRTALLAIATLPKLQAVHEGDTLGRYRIVGILPGEVRAEGPAGPVTLRMGPRRRESEPAQQVAIEAPHAAIGAPDQDE